jgi:hypothetical protein
MYPARLRPGNPPMNKLLQSVFPCATAVALLIAIAFPFDLAAQVKHGDFAKQTLTFSDDIQDSFVADFDADGLPDIFVTHTIDTDRGGGRCFSVFFQKKGSGFPETAASCVRLPAEATAVTFGDFLPSPGLEVVYFCASGVMCYRLDGGSYSAPPERLIFTPTFCRTANQDKIRFWTEPTDIDGNGMHDLLVPVPGGFKAFMQTAPGVFGMVSEIRMPPGQGIVGQADFQGRSSDFFVHDFLTVEKALPLPAIVDFDGDSRRDLVFLCGNSIVFFLQLADGSFTWNRSGEIPMPLRDTRAGGNEIKASFATLTDVNNDSRADLVITQTFGELGILENMTVKIALFLNSGDGHIASTPSHIVNLKGASTGAAFTDLNMDGYPDMVVTCLRTDMWSAIKQGLLRSMRINFYGFLFDNAKQRFSDGPDLDRYTDISTSVIDSGGKFFPYLIFDGDFDGDRRRDMLRVEPPNSPDIDGILKIYPGEPGGGLRDEVAFSVDEYFSLPVQKIPRAIICRWDLNGDGRTDPVLTYSSSVIVLMSR